VIDHEETAPLDSTAPLAGQAELPFDEPPARRGYGGLRDRLIRARRMIRERPGAAAGAAGEFLLRWILRIALPISGAAAMLHLFPYHASAGGVHIQVQATLFTRSGISADTSFGSWIFSDVDGLPIGIHISPENVDVVRMAASATQDPQAYVDSLRQDFSDQVPRILVWLGAEALIGVLIGLVLAAAINLAVRYLRRAPWRSRELRRRSLQLAAAVTVVGIVVGYGALSYNENWSKRSRLTGTLGALQLFPGQLAKYYQQHATAFDVVNGIANIQAQLQQHLDQTKTPATSFEIMYISDLHLAGTYPLVQQYAENFGVSLIVNTGDESQFGTAPELTAEYRKQIRDVTRIAPMIWMSGNHDSPTTQQIMASIPGVIVVGDKTADGLDGFQVAAQQLDAFGLHIAAMPDPRVYGASGAYGENDGSGTQKLEEAAIDAALKGIAKDAKFDIFATHEPVAGARAVRDLPGRIRQLNTGHLHKQNAASDIQNTDVINLNEGSTGAGGLKEVGIDFATVPIEFSIESVAADCQFTKVVRFQLAGASPATASVIAASELNVTASTIYLKPQRVDEGRACSPSLGVGKAGPVS
jgi:hypothetical protein